MLKQFVPNLQRPRHLSLSQLAEMAGANNERANFEKFICFYSLTSPYDSRLTYPLFSCNNSQNDLDQ